MYTLNGFTNVAPFAINRVGVIAPIGELSTQSQTYSREIGQYQSKNYPDVLLFSFLSTNDTTSIEVPAAIATQVLKFSQWLYNRTVAGQASNDRDQILEDLLTTYQAEANSFDCGQVKYSEDNRYALPEWLEWKHNSYEGGANFVKIYFSDASFRAQYDKFQIIPVYPFLPVDDFFLGPEKVVPKLTGRSNEQLTLDIETAKAGYPETLMWGGSFDYVSPLDGKKTAANFNAMIHGAAGNTIDNIKDAITSAILAASTHTRDEWIKILPDLFKRTEFILTPRFDLYGIPDSAQQTGIYSPVQKYNSELTIAKQTAVGYTAAHVQAYLQTLTLYYKSSACLVVGGPENRDEKFLFTDYFKDYIVVAPQSTDYSRMSKYTADFIYMLQEMLIVAEEMTEFSSVPRGMTRLMREGVMYVVRSYDKVQYLVAAKWNFLPK